MSDFCLGAATKQAVDHYLLMNGNWVKLNLSSADVMSGEVAARPAVSEETEQREKETSERGE